VELFLGTSLVSYMLFILLFGIWDLIFYTQSHAQMTAAPQAILRVVYFHFLCSVLVIER